MKKQYLKLFTILPVIAVLAGVNFYQDPANIFHDPSKDAAAAILAGNKVYFTSGNLDESRLKKNMIEKMPKEVDCIAIGGSLIMGVRKNHVGTQSFYSIAAFSLRLCEMMAEIAMLELNQIKYDRLILCADHRFFNVYPFEPRKSEWKPYFEYMLSKLDGDISLKLEINPDINPKSYYDKIRQLFSVRYFQSSCKYIQSRNSFRLKERRWGIVDAKTQDLAHYEADGSWVYALNYRNSTINDVSERIEKYDIKLHFAYNKHLNDYNYNVDRFKRLLTYLVEKGINISLFLCPVPPSIWDILETESSNYMLIKETEEFIKGYADELGIKLIGSYNPYIVGISDEDFLDATHIRHEKLEDYFDFK